MIRHIYTFGNHACVMSNQAGFGASNPHEHTARATQSLW